METLLQQNSEEIEREKRVAKLVWEGLSHAVEHGTRQPEEVTALYQEWFGNFPTAA